MGIPSVVGPGYLGDYKALDVVNFKFNTFVDGVPTDPTTLDIKVYEANSDASETTDGVIFYPTFDSFTGLCHVYIGTAANGTFYANDKDFQVVATDMTLGGANLNGVTLAHFSLAHRSVRDVVGDVSGNIQGNIQGNINGDINGNINSPAIDEIADSVLRRNSTNARASAYGDAVNFRSLLGAISKLTNLIQVNAGNLETMEEDDATPFGTQAITTTPGADPITKLDTA